MTKQQAANTDERKKFNVITYEEEVAFNYTLPGKDEQETIETEITLIWEETIDRFKEVHGEEKAYEVHSFSLEKQRQFFIDQIENRTEALIEEVEEEIANKMKYGFEFTGQLHNDD
jgi:tRNA A37 N6-isopentenylltransferase MiaA